MRDFAIHMTHRPGELERITDALARSGVNLKSVAALAIDNKAMLRLIPDDVERARTAFRESNIHFEETEVISVLLENHAGELAALASKMAKAGLSLQAAYVVGLEDDLIELAIVVDNVKKAKKVLE